jgi:phosphoribosyl 1,2-cyclic phosphodiesterase
MLIICVLGSGSKGNAIYVNCDGQQFLVDCGFTKRETSKRLATIGRKIDDLDRVFVTHDHGDHCAPWIKKEGFYRNGDFSEFHCKDMVVRSFPLSHDSDSGSYGYVIQDKDGNRAVIAMDTGCIPEEVLPYFFDASIVMIETNYNIDMLINSPYPSELQERIASDVGHLRDECAAEVVGAVMWPGLKYVVAMHLSSNCINPVLARFELESVLSRGEVGFGGIGSGGGTVELVVSEQVRPSKMMVVM